jgi:hypothetical protein
MADIKRVFLGYLIGLLLLFGLFFYVGIEKIVELLTEFQIIYLIPAVCLFLLVLCLNALNLKIMYSPIVSLDYFFLLKKYIISWALGTVLPSRAGEFSLAYFLRDCIPIGKSTAILVLDKLVSLAVFSFFSILAMLYFFGFREALHLFLILLALGFLVIFFILSERARGLLKNTLFATIKHHFTGFSKTLWHYLKEERRIIFANFTLTLVRLLLQSMIIFLLFLGFREIISPLTLICVVSVVTILSLLPLTPNGLGIRQVSLVFFIGILGIGAVKTASVSLILFIINYGFVLIVLYTAALKKLFAK